MTRFRRQLATVERTIPARCQSDIYGIDFDGTNVYRHTVNEPMEGIVFFGISTLQDIHVLLSLIGIAAGLIVVYGLVESRRMEGMTLLFLASTLLTNLTGFLFPITGFTPAIGVGIIGTAVMILCLVARYIKAMHGRWRGIYVVTAVISLYLNVFVLVVQLFLKVPALNAFAPNGNEPPFAIVQGVVLLAAIIFGWLATRRFRPLDA